MQAKGDLVKRDLLSQEEFNRLREIKRRNRDKLFRLPNVNGVGIGFKEVNGESTDQIAIRVYVTKKLSKEKLKRDELIPSGIEGTVTDVIEIGEIHPCAHLTRERPAKGGASISRCDVSSRGTLGGACFYDNVDDERVILTCNHVLTNCDFPDPNAGERGDPVAQPGLMDGGVCPQDTIATLERFVEYLRPPSWNKVDAGMATVSSGSGIVSDEIHDIGVPTGTRTLNALDVLLHTRVQKSGATTGLTTGQVTDISFDGAYPICGVHLQFEDQILIPGMVAAGGDSGALVLDGDKKIVGMVIAVGGTPEEGNIYVTASPIAAILSELSIRFELTAATTSTSTTTSSTSTSTTTISTSTTTISTSTTTGTSTSTSATTTSTSTTTVSTSTTTTTLLYRPLNWSIEIVDSNANIANLTSLAIDNNGYLHIGYPVYTGAFKWELRYAYQDSSGWHIEVVDDVAEPTWCFLALDSSNYPHIAYHTSDNDDLRYAYKDVGGWHLETVESATLVGMMCSLALDSSDYPHISYRKSPDRLLRYAYKDAGGWNFETVDTYSSAIYTNQTSIALDSSGYPHIVYPYHNITTLQFDLKYAYKDAVGWHLSILVSDAAGPSLTLSSDDYPHIGYIDNSNYDLGYTYKDISGWHVEIIDSAGYVGYNDSLALDTDGYPHISYYDFTSGDLKYAHKDADGWHVEAADTDGDVGEYTSLVLDSNGKPHISYYDYDNDYLKHAYQALRAACTYFFLA